MECIPAIDVREGRSVRLLRGDFSVETVYGDPLEQARAYAEAGATRLHVVDLDAARSGIGANDEIVSAIARGVSVPIEVGGGVRSLERAAQLIESGVDRVVVGTAAIEDHALLERLAELYPGRIAVGVDHRAASDGATSRREVAVRGWEVGSGRELTEVLAELDAIELAAVIVTDIGRDGTLAGPDLEGMKLALSSSRHDVIASGGVGTVADLVALRQLERTSRGVAGVIVGRALLSGAITIEEAMLACAA